MSKKIEEMIKKWRGENKIQAKRRDKLENGMYRLVYVDENGDNAFIDDIDKKVIDEILIEFGGLNNETVAGPSKFLTMGTWTSQDFEELGHRIQKITISGERELPNNKIKIQVPKNCGYTQIVDSKKKQESCNPVVNKTITYKEKIGEVTVSFRSTEEFDNFREFLMSDPNINGLRLYVKKLNTLSVDSRKHCTWTRAKAGDGTERMELQLTHLDGKEYKDCIHYELVEAADGMIESECKKLFIEHSVVHGRTICALAAERGDVKI